MRVNLEQIIIFEYSEKKLTLTDEKVCHNSIPVRYSDIM
jgi:hypothetical protein